MNEEFWIGALLGESIPGVKIPFPPKVYPLAYKHPDRYVLKDGEIFLGIWSDGEITLCKYSSGDFILNLNGEGYMTGGAYGGPSWMIPLMTDQSEGPLQPA